MQRSLLVALLVLGCSLPSSAQVPLAYGEPYYQVNNSKTSEVIEYGANIEYLTFSNVECQSRLDTKENEKGEVRSARCASKCAKGKNGEGKIEAPFWCDGYNSDTDSDDSSVLCLPQSECSRLCSISDDCHSYSMRPRPTSGGSHRCFLNTFECQNSATWDNTTGTLAANKMYIKTFADAPACALGLGAEVRSAKYPGTDGLYEWKSDSLYQQLDGGAHRISWHSTGCGWMVERDNSTAGGCGSSCAVPNCTDDNAATNFAFFQTTGASYQDNVCTMAASWGAGSYCANKIFQGLCPQTCGGVAVDACLGDNNVAAQEALKFLKDVDVVTGMPACEHTSVACSDPLFASLCKATCSVTRRLQASDVMQKEPVWGDKFRALMTTLSVTERRLKWTDDGSDTMVYEELYSTFDPYLAGTCTSSASPSRLMLAKQGLFDVKTGLQPIMGMTTSESCSKPKTFNTNNDQYCSHNNIAAAFNEYPDVVLNQCRYKCGDDTVSRANWCHGNSLQFQNHSNALCLPRERCEELCKNIAECHSIDMHRHIPRCYLNTASCATATITTNLTMDLLIPQERSDRKTFTTFTDKGCLGTGYLTHTESTRSLCENNCSSSFNCTGFNFARSIASSTGSCTLLSGENCGSWLTGISTLFGINGTDYVRMNTPPPCTATVANAPNSVFNTEYFGVSSALNPLAYLAKSNRTRLIWSSGVTGQCNGWFVQENQGPASTTTLYNCTDSNAAANLFLYGADTTNDKKFVCEWGREQGKCVNTTFAALCAFSCGSVMNATIGSELFFFQDRWQGDWVNTSCTGDNSEALHSFMSETTIKASSWFPVIGAAFTNWTCPDMADQYIRLGFPATDAPCYIGAYAPVVSFLCKTSCAGAAYPTAVPTATPSDEKDFEYGQLAPTRRMTTASYADAMVTITTLPVEHYLWSTAYKTWANGTEDTTQPQSGSWFMWRRNNVTGNLYLHASSTGAACDMTSQSTPVTASLNSNIVFPAYVPVDPTSQMLSVCRNASICPELTTCVLGRGRFRDEMNLWRASYVPAHDWISMATADTRGQMLSPQRFVPKTIISELRSEARLVYDKWEFGKTLFRNAPGTTRFSLRNPGAPGITLVLTQASARAHEGATAKAQLGREYMEVEGFKDWKTDVLRVERFSGNDTMEVGLFEFEVFVPGVNVLTMFVFPPGAHTTAQRLDSTAVTKLAGGWFRVRSLAANRDFVGTEDKDECADDNGGCHANADCVNNLGGEPTCTCKTRYTGDGKLCILGSYQYTTPSSAQEYFRLYHGNSLDYGWRIKQLKLYKDAECTVEATAAAPTLITTSAAYPDYMTGITFANTNILDSNLATEWWSECLNCDPEDVDKAHGSAAWIDFTFTESVDVVKCVKLWQDTNHGASNLVLQRGPLTGDGCDALADGTRCPPTQTWTVDEVGEEAVIPIVCGRGDTQIFGEVLVNPTTGTETGNYHYVPSECKCQALCIDHLEEGCRSWKYYAKFRHCILQSSVFKTGQGYWGVRSQTFVGWSSGDFQEEGAARMLGMTISTETVKPRQPFNITVRGVGLPYSDQKAKDTSLMQRVKIVDAEASCRDAVPTTVQGLFCSKTTRNVRTEGGYKEEDWYTICSSRPSVASHDTVQFDDFKIMPAKKTLRYKVCYCAGSCSDAIKWSPLPNGEIEVKSSTFEWFTDPPKVYRRMLKADSTYGNEFVLSVKRPAFGSYSNPSNWRLRVVRNYFDCDVKTNTSLFTISDSRTSVNGIDVAQWNITINETKLTVFETGDYAVCFSETGVAGSFWEIPSLETQHLTVNRIEADTMFGRGLWGAQRFSVRAPITAGSNITTRITAKGNRLIIPSESTLFVNTHASAKCGVSSQMEFNGSPFASARTFFPNNYASSTVELVYDIEVPNVASGSYPVCYCDAMQDSVLNASLVGLVVAPSDALNMSTTYKLLDDRFCSGTVMTYANMPTTTQAHQCKAKCAKGCLGTECFCENWDAHVTPDTALCLSPILCRKLCDSDPTCTGVDIHEDKAQCYLNTGASNTAAACALNESFVHVIKREGVACGTPEDFTRAVGIMHITNRVHLGNEYIMSPGKKGSLEVTAPEGSSLTYDDYGTSKDRIMVVDCQGVCGVSPPTEALALPEDATKITTWNLLWPMGFFIDRPHNDSENPADIPAAARAPKVWKYNPKDGYYCPGNNFNLKLPQYAELDKHQCYNKCSLRAPCTWPDCFCDGHYSGFDGPSSNALCLNQTHCQTLCNKFDECSSYDMHKTLNRCFLNGLGCDASAHEDMLGRDPTYKLVWKQEDVTDTGNINGGSGPAGTRRMSATPRQLLAPVDKGYSWDRLLRFAPLKIDGGGSFKLCFCDSSLLPANSTCSQTKDYMVEVGKVHSSGIACLLEDPEQRFTKGKCIPMFYGGLRCYDDNTTPVQLVPPYYTSTSLAAMAFSTPSQMDTWCLYGPEEITQGDARCEQVAGYQSTEETQ